MSDVTKCPNCGAPVESQISRDEVQYACGSTSDYTSPSCAGNSHSVQLSRGTVAGIFQAKKPAERVALFAHLMGMFCWHCGELQPAGRFCPCTNDE